jgi:hypothetical protein
VKLTKRLTPLIHGTYLDTAQLSTCPWTDQAWYVPVQCPNNQPRVNQNTVPNPLPNPGNASRLGRPFLFASNCQPLPAVANMRGRFANVCNGICQPLPPFNFGGLFQRCASLCQGRLFLRAFADAQCQPLPTFPTQCNYQPILRLCQLKVAILLLPTLKPAFAGLLCRPF